jgi:type IV secretory pathway TrbF-like protein
MIAPLVNNPPSKNKWNDMIFTVIGKIRSDARAIRFVAISTILIANTIAIMYMI